MTTFTNLFSSYASNADYINARDSLLETDENSLLKSGNIHAGIYPFKQPYTIGFGYDVSQQSSGQVIINNFATASISLSTALSNLLANYSNGSGHNSTTLSQLDNQFATDFGTTGLTYTQAVGLLKASMTSTKGTT